MKIETNTIVEFLKNFRMGEIQTCLLEFKEEGLFISAMSLTNSYRADVYLNKLAFKEYTPIGNIGVDDLDKLINVFKRLGKELEFSVEGNLCIAKGNNKELLFELIDEKFIEKPKELPNMEHSTSFVLSAKDFNECLTDASMNKDTSMTFETVDGGVKISNTGKYKFNRYFNSEETKSGVKVSFGQPISSALGGLKDGIIKFSVKTDYPLLAEIKDEHFELTFMIAPLVDSGE